MTQSATASTVPAKPALGVLESSGLIRLAATHPELEYLFRHVLVQDAAYDSLLKQERRRLHLAVAETLEQLYPDRRAELSGMLAYHIDAAGEPARALPFLVEAGEHALQRYANEEAERFFDRAAELVPPGDDPELVRLRAEIALGRATSGWASRAPQATLAIIDEALPLAERVGDVRLLGKVLFWRAFLLGNFGGDPQPAIRPRGHDRASARHCARNGGSRARGQPPDGAGPRDLARASRAGRPRSSNRPSR